MHVSRRYIRSVSGSFAYTGLLFHSLVAAAPLAARASVSPPVARPGGQSGDPLSALCNPDSVKALMASSDVDGVSVKRIPNGAFKAATSYVVASGAKPAFCQVTGSFVTNPKTGKTANFLATFPANWNSKYLQLGCSLHCGQFYVSNPAVPTVAVTTQGDPDALIAKGYAIFATDEGHVGMASASWAVTKSGSVDRDAIDDLFFRADKVMARMGKRMTVAFYGKLTGRVQTIERAYFDGCSGGGRDALVAASYFPEEFDGIIAGSAYNMLGVTYQGSGIGLAAHRSADAYVSPTLMALVDTVVKKGCDRLDGVTDGIIQNPAACDFDAVRDLPHCAGDTPGDNCFTKAQAETISTVLTATTDEHGNVVQPGYSVSELAVSLDGHAELNDPVQTVFVHDNDPSFSVKSNYTFAAGGRGPITSFRAIVPAAEIARAKAALAPGVGHFPEHAGRLLAGKTKLLMWHNFSDEKLSPYNSINYYKGLAKRAGGYAKLQKQARLFMLPGTGHCSINGIAPNSFDALTAMEKWVENGVAPEALLLTVANRQFSPREPKAPALQYPQWSMPACKFPEMAHYKGAGDRKDAANWWCPPGDESLLKVGPSGRQAGVS